MNLRNPGILRNYRPGNRGKTFLVLHILLFIGSIAIVSTLLYILLNLEKSDKIIFKALPIIVSGLILILFYTVGYHRLTEKGNKRKPSRMQFMDKLKLHRR